MNQLETKLQVRPAVAGVAGVPSALCATAASANLRMAVSGASLQTSDKSSLEHKREATALKGTCERLEKESQRLREIAEQARHASRGGSGPSPIPASQYCDGNKPVFVQSDQHPRSFG